MGRILAIDYGKKRTGLAVTDPLKIIATGLTTVETKGLMAYLLAYLAREPVDLFIIGDPKNNDGSETDATRPVNQFIGRLGKSFPGVPVIRMDERYTSRMASRSMVESGMKKKDRRNKALVDEISAVLILQGYLQSH
ncbi:MAG TPA: Holliday junction resolvase RuvX [Chitinophagaceae bacterium]|nr:Holliday junction resolvase RuvX [Chitinophagaceae bacterium]